MKEIWKWLTAILAGMIIGILLWEKIDVKAVYNGRVKIKQRGKDNVMDSDVVLTVREARQLVREKRKEKRKAKRLKIKNNGI